MKKIKKLLLTALIVMSALFQNVSSIYASSINVTTTASGYTHTGTAVNPSQPATSSWFDARSIDFITLSNGKTGFCIEPWTLVDTGTGYTNSTQEITAVSKIIYHGYENTSQTKWDYAVTQLMIWEMYSYTPTSHTVSGYATRKSEINALINSHDTKVSFSGGSYEVNAGETLKITDTNGVLSQFTWSSNSNVTVTSSGNTLSITPTASATDGTITLKASKYITKFIGSSFVYTKTGEQTIYSGMLSDPVTIELDVKINATEPEYATLTSTKTATETVNVALTKTDVDNDKTLSNAKFDFYRDDVLFASDVVSNASGVASATYTYTHSYTTGSYTYCTNYDELTSYGTDKVASAGAYTSKALAQAQADKDAQAGADALASKTHTYKAVETASKTAYYLDASNSTVSSSITGSGNVALDMTNKRILGTAVLTKVDAETGATAQGDATLEGAVFGLYASSNIVDPADNSVVYTAGTKVSEVTIANGTAKVENLYLGNYYWQELKAPTGYTLNEEQYNFALTQNGNNAVVTTSITAENEVIKGTLRIIKSVDALIEQTLLSAIVPFTTVLPNGEGFVFNVTLKSTGEVVATLVSDENGFILSDPLPYGAYTISEESAEGYSALEPFDVTIDEHNKVYHFNIMNQILKSEIRIEKVDADTGNVIPVAGVSFKLKDSNGNYVSQTLANVDTWKTDENGMITLHEPLNYGSTFTLEEVSGTVPHNYLLNMEGLTFTVDGSAVITLRFENKAVKGEIEVYKEGEVLTDTVVDEDGNTDFIYEVKGLQGTVFEVYANEDIKAEDLVNEDYYKEGDLVETLVTDEDGKASLKDLPLGKYYVVEVEASSGFILDDTIRYVELTYVDEKTEIIYESLSLVNERAKVTLDATKTLEKNIVSGFEDAYKDVIFHLYATSDIYNCYNELLVEQGSFLYAINIDEQGKFITKDLPKGTYYVQEYATNEAYIIDENEYHFEIDTIIENKVVTINGGKDLVNELKDFEVEIVKVDSLTKKTIVSSHFEFTRYADEDCTVVIETVSADTTTGTATFTDVHYGTTYIKETKAPEGYMLSDEVVVITITDDSEKSFSIEYQNTLLGGAQTGDSTNTNLYIGLMFTTGLLSMFGLLMQRRRKESSI